MFVVGVDGCRGGWLAVKLSLTRRLGSRSFSFLLLWESYQDAALILVDIPIGLLEDAHGPYL